MHVMRNELQLKDAQLQNIFDNAVVGGCSYLKSNLAVRSLIIGMSGGIDSLITAIMARAVVDRMNNRPDSGDYRLIGYSLPIITNEDDEIQRAKDAGNAICDNFAEVDLSKAYMNLIQSIDNSLFYDMYGHEAPRPHDSKIRAGNIKARLRMMFLYDKAAKYKGMVLSTDNFTEYLLGFWTLHGDVGDFGFIQELWKTEVYALADYLAKEGVHTQALQETCDANPTDGLGVSDGDLSQLLPDWTGGHRAGYEHVDEMLQAWVNEDEYVGEARLPISTMMETHPVLIRHLASEFKRYNPINLDRMQLVGIIG